MNPLQLVLVIAIAFCTAKATASEFPLDILEGGPNDPNAQVLPCILYIRETDYQNDIDGHRWECKVFGPDAESAGALPEAKHAMVEVDGMDLVLASNSEVASGITTLYTKRAVLANHTLTITSESQLFFGEDHQPTGARRRRKLAAGTGDLSVLVVRVTTNDASLNNDAFEIGDNIFGTHGDVINLKSNVEDCSNRETTINPATGSGSACQDMDGFGGAITLSSGTKVDCHFFSRLEILTETDYCAIFGDNADVDGGSLTANTACCACGGGTTTTYSNPVTDGVLELSLDMNAVGMSRNDLEEAAERQLESLFKTDFLGLVFDLVMFCVPQGTFRESDGSDEWLAYSYIGGFLSLYNGDAQCGSASTAAHEVGHNWGLRHSSEVVDDVPIEYGDSTGVMGYSVGALDEEIFGNKFCYNGAHSWQLGWYINDNLEIDPMTESYVGGLAGVDKLPNLASDEKVVLKLTNSTSDFYLMFNHAFGANEGTAEAQNQVTLTSKSTSFNSFTYLRAKISGNQYATFSNYDGQGTKLTIFVKSIDASENGRAEIEVFKGSFQDRVTLAPTSGPTSAPTSGQTASPTTAPTSSPTNGPTSGPTSSPTSRPTIEPTSGPTSEPTAYPTSGPTSVPTGAPTSSPTSGPTSTPTSGSTTNEEEEDKDKDEDKDNETQRTESNGDPHFKTWKDEHFEFHGQCDIVMVSNKNFSNGLGLDIHLRTKMVRFWSYIKVAVLRIGNDILEVEGSADRRYNLKYWINNEPMGELTTVGGFPISIDGNKEILTIDLDNMYPGQKIQLKTFKEFVGVKIIGATVKSFGDSVGITGDFSTGNTYARDGVTVLNDFNELGNEWQVLPSDGRLFHETSQPQFPERCWIPEESRGERRRRLDESSITEEQAEAACAELLDEFSRKGCVYDILATQDLEMVGAY